MNIIEEKLTTNTQTLKILEDREKNQENPLSRMQMISLDFLKKATEKLKAKEENGIIEKLKSEVPVLKENHIIAILNCPPKDEEDVDVLFSKERLSLEKDSAAKIVEIVKPFFIEIKKK
ncbi:MAG: hypothetical protein KAR87_05810 [Candidatus Aenigmarchaeota archaeon]|nr:hypothetical protein [Candidatus Aenigmarchaeota archaeon]